MKVACSEARRRSLSSSVVNRFIVHCTMDRAGVTLPACDNETMEQKGFGFPFAFALALLATASTMPVLALTIHRAKAPRQVIYPNVMYPNPVQTTGSESNAGCVTLAPTLLASKA